MVLILNFYSISGGQRWYYSYLNQLYKLNVVSDVYFYTSCLTWIGFSIDDFFRMFLSMNIQNEICQQEKLSLIL